jgi:transforming growth factor-beta-induced protein
MLESNKDYSMFLKFIKKANLTSLLEDDKSELTVFVPKDDVFREVQDWYTEMLENPKDLDNVIKSHIISDVLCCAGIVRSDWPFIRTVETVNNQQLKLNRDRRPLVQNAGVSKCDIIAKNGIIHEINDVIATNQHHQQQQAQSSELRPNFFNQQLPSFW